MSSKMNTCPCSFSSPTPTENPSDSAHSWYILLLQTQLLPATAAALWAVFFQQNHASHTNSTVLHHSPLLGAL